MCVRAYEIVDLDMMWLHRPKDFGLLLAILSPRHDIVSNLDVLYALFRAVRHLDLRSRREAEEPRAKRVSGAAQNAAQKTAEESSAARLMRRLCTRPLARDTRERVRRCTVQAHRRVPGSERGILRSLLRSCRKRDGRPCHIGEISQESAVCRGVALCICPLLLREIRPLTERPLQV